MTKPRHRKLPPTAAKTAAKTAPPRVYEHITIDHGDGMPIAIRFFETGNVTLKQGDNVIGLSGIEADQIKDVLSWRPM